MGLGVNVKVSLNLFPIQVNEVTRTSGIAALTLAADAVEQQAILNTPGLGRTPYEPTSLRTGKLRSSFSKTVSISGREAFVYSSTPYSVRQEYRIVKSGNRKAYLRPALIQAKLP